MEFPIPIESERIIEKKGWKRLVFGSQMHGSTTNWSRSTVTFASYVAHMWQYDCKLAMKSTWLA